MYSLRRENASFHLVRIDVARAYEKMGNVVSMTPFSKDANSPKITSTSCIQHTKDSNPKSTNIKKHLSFRFGQLIHFLGSLATDHARLE